jgi:hypothetical protein
MEKKKMKKAYLLKVFLILFISFTLMKEDIKTYQEKEKIIPEGFL